MTILAVVKADCPTCRLVTPVLDRLGVEVVSEDDDAGLERSWRLGVDTVPTLVRLGDDGGELGRIVGWSRAEWEAFTGVAPLGEGLPEQRPGCGSRTLDPDQVDGLAVRFGAGRLASRRVDLAELEDEHEALFDRGWTDGLPVVAPTEARVLRMLQGTSRAPDEIVAVVPPDLVDCTVEKVAVNAVLAGCRPEYLPVVLAAVQAVCTTEFNMHGLLATTWFAGPLVIVDGPIARRIGMNSGVNAMGQGNRANATIGRALQLVVRNVGGGRPGGVDRARRWGGRASTPSASPRRKRPIRGSRWRRRAALQGTRSPCSPPAGSTGSSTSSAGSLSPSRAASPPRCARSRTPSSR